LQLTQFNKSNPEQQMKTKQTITKTAVRALCSSLLVILLGTLLAGQAHGQNSWNTYQDFSLTNGNPNGVWSYGWSTTLFSSLNLYPNSGVDVNGNKDWYDPSFGGVGSVPAVEANTSNNQQATVPPMTSIFHPGPNGEYSHYVWTAPVTSVYSLSALFSPFDFGGTDVHILDNGVSIFSGEVSPGSPQSFSDIFTANAGDKIDFAVGFGTDGSYFSDTTGINATIEAVPEASTWATGLLTAGTLLCSIWHRRKA
jgi:hypothetical protein